MICPNPNVPARCIRAFLPNVSVFDRPLPQVLEARQHGQHPFELAVEMDLISAELFQLAGVQRLAECLLADQECSTSASRKRRRQSASVVAGASSSFSW